MQDFTVIQYGSDASEQFYGYWFNRITMQFKMQEKLTVLNGKRKQFIDVIDVSKLEQFKQFIIDNNLYYAILNTTSRNTNYSQSGQHGTDMLRIIVSTDPIQQPNDSREIGKLLGYPSEDIEFFIDKYENQKDIDPTWWQVNDKFKTDEYTKVVPFGSVQSTLVS